MAQSENSVTSITRTETCEFTVGQIVEYNPSLNISHYATIITLTPRLHTAYINYYNGANIDRIDVNCDKLTRIVFGSDGKVGGGLDINDDIAYTKDQIIYNGKYIVKANTDDEHYIMYLDNGTPKTALVKTDTITFPQPKIANVKNEIITSDLHPMVKDTAKNQSSIADRAVVQDKKSQGDSISVNNSGQFNIDINRNVNQVDGYTIQRITGSTTANGKYNMINLNLNIPPGIDEDGRKKMASKISRAIDLILSHIGNDDDSVNDDNSVHAFSESIRDITDLFNSSERILIVAAPITKAQKTNGLAEAKKLTKEDKTEQIQTTRGQRRREAIKNAITGVANTFTSVFSSGKTQPDGNKTNLDQSKTNRKGGKLSRKRKRNMTKSKKRKVRTTRRRR